MKISQNSFADNLAVVTFKNVNRNIQRVDLPEFILDWRKSCVKYWLRLKIRGSPKVILEL